MIVIHLIVIHVIVIHLILIADRYTLQCHSAWRGRYARYWLGRTGEPFRGGRRTANVAVMAPGFALNLLLLSPVMHWAVLMNTNARHGCEEGIQTLGNEVFAYRKLCDPPTYASRELEEALQGVPIWFKSM